MVCVCDDLTGEPVVNNMYSYPVQIYSGGEFVKEVTLDGLDVGRRYCFYLGKYNHENITLANTYIYTLSDVSSGIQTVPVVKAPVVVYDLNGQRISDDGRKGIVIMNGKKVMR